MNVLILGQGAREHAIAQIISKSNLYKKLYVYPGNSITNEIYNNIPLGKSINDFDYIKQVIVEKNIDLVFSGSEEPLVNGIYDFLTKQEQLKNVIVIGPCKQGSMLEGSKVFAKNFMQKYKIPTAKYKDFTQNTISEALKYIRCVNFPIVIKADGLAAGKGVLICQNYKEASEGINTILKENKFGQSGKQIVIEDFLDGIEASIFIATDGSDYVLLPSAKDYKKIGLNDTGPNTGGMGAISPPPFLNNELLEKIKTKIIAPTILGLKNENIQYKGFIFIGIINVNSEPYVLEYNVRLGDPETECILPKIESDFLELLIKIGNGTLSSYRLQTNNLYSATIVLASEGYPTTYETGKIISGINKVENSIINYAGVVKVDNQLKTNSGRVMTVTSLSKTLKEAVNKSINSANLIHFGNKYFRKDIGYDL